ncbi:MAG: ASPIC/UnbV domain-containing protein, partial [Wenzhouxiangellaceae bacterium]
TSTDPWLRRERLTLYLNRAAVAPGGDGFLVVRPRMVVPNSHALGAELRLVLDDGRTLTRWIRAGESWMSQAPASAHFGIGAAAIERLEIDWPSSPGRPGGTSRIAAPPVNGVLEVTGPETLFAESFEP